MDVLTSAADAILSEESDLVVLTPTKDNGRPVLGDLTNSQKTVRVSRPIHIGSSMNSLFNEKITCNNLSVPKLNLKTPRKRRKNSAKYGDENQAPSPKTPKNENKEKFNFTESPITPLSNLKMLTRIASMEEHIPSKKDLFQTQQPSSYVTKLGLRRCVSESTKHSSSAEQSTKTKLKKYTTISDLEQSSLQNVNKASEIATVVETSRREKSLGLLCEKFLDHFPLEVSCLETPRRLVIDDVASMLGTERRRVYDIVNILECLNMASRVQKNMYQWMGKQHLETTLSKLKGLAEDWGLEYMTLPIEQSLRDIKNGKTPTISPISLGEKSEARKEKSIGILCQKFLMLFLISKPPHIIQLEMANHLLLGQEGDDLEKLRKRGRRIYDIANVLVSLRLIKKLSQSKSFMYIGPLVDSIKRKEVDGQSQIRLRHSLLPPPIMEFVLQKPHISSDSIITPSEDELANSFPRKGRPRKLATDFVLSKAKRNCMVIRTKSKESLVNCAPQAIKNSPSLDNIILADEQEEKQKLRTPTERNCNLVAVPFDTQRNVHSKPFRFTHFGSPRMALTFENPSMKSPPALTSRPPLSGANIPKVVVRPPFILRKVNLNTPPENSNKKQLYIISSTYSGGTTTTSGGMSSSMQITNSLLSDRSSGCFKVYCRNDRTMSLPSLPRSVNTNTPPATPLTSVSQVNEPKTLGKSLSQNILPNISLNTLSRNHYKTVFGSSQIPSQNLTPSKGLYHFIINSKGNPPPPLSTTGNVVKQPSFVKIFQTSPDNSSTDSELESIFGDSFKFTRPKNLVNKI